MWTRPKRRTTCQSNRFHKGRSLLSVLNVHRRTRLAHTVFGQVSAIGIHYQAVRWRLIPDDVDKCAGGVGSEKTRSGAPWCANHSSVPTNSDDKSAWQSASRLLIMGHVCYSKYLKEITTSTVLSRARCCLYKKINKWTLNLASEVCFCTRLPRPLIISGSRGHDKSMKLNPFFKYSPIFQQQMPALYKVGPRCWVPQSSCQWGKHSIVFPQVSPHLVVFLIKQLLMQFTVVLLLARRRQESPWFPGTAVTFTNVPRGAD